MSATIVQLVRDRIALVYAVFAPGSNFGLPTQIVQVFKVPFHFILPFFNQSNQMKI